MTSATHKAHLSWVRPPIEKAIGRAQLALDAYFEKISVAQNPPSGVQQSWIDNQRKDAEAKIPVLITEVGLIHGALVMVGSPGGSALSKEMSTVCSSIEEGLCGQQDRDKALMALMGGLVTLPNYISMVIAGAPDSPAIVARSINEIREVRNVPLLAGDSALPDMQFSFVDPPYKDSSVDPAHRARVFDAVARPFQKAFGSWIGSQSKQSLQEMKTILADLQVVTHQQEVGCYWWVAEALVDQLIEGGLRHNNNTVTQLRTVSVAIQKASINGEDAAQEALGNERFKSLLYVLSMSKSQNDASEAVLSRFNVSSGVESESLKLLQQKLDRSSNATTATVAAEVETLLSQGMVSLGRAVTATGPEAFKAQAGVFLAAIRDIANIFFMVNDEELATIAKTAAGRINESSTIQDLTEDVIDALKGDLLYLHARLKNITENEATRALGIEGLSPDVISAVVAESLKTLVSVRRSIALHVDSGEAKDALQSGLEDLLSVASVTSFAGALKVGAILRGVANSLISQLDGDTLSENAEYENAARGLVSVEIYLESIHAGFDPDPKLLDEGRKALELNNVIVADVAVPKRSELISLFESASSISTEEEDPLLLELSELRAKFESFAVRQDFNDREGLKALHQASDRISMSGKIRQIDSLDRLGRALATFAAEVYGVARNESFDVVAASALGKEAAALMIRCFDEYAAKGNVAIFVTDIANALLQVVSVRAEEHAADAADQAGSAPSETSAPAGSEHVTQPEVAIVVEASEVILASEVDDAEVEYPEGVDPYMMELYRAEYKSNHDAVISSLSTDNPMVTEYVCRAVHSLRGCSGSAQCMPLNRTFAALENRLREMGVNGPSISADSVNQVIELLNECMEFHHAFPWQQTSNLEDAWIDMAKSIGGVQEIVEFEVVEKLSLHSGEDEAGPLSTPESGIVAESSEIDPIEVEVSGSQLREDETCLASPVDQSEAVQPAESFEQEDDLAAKGVEDIATACLADALLESSRPLSPEPVHQVMALLPADYDKELASYYIEEADERLPQLQDNFQAWLADIKDRELIHTIKRQMHTLKGAAAMAGLAPIQDVTHLMESLFESLSLNIIPADQSCIDLVEIVLQEIGGLSSAVRAHRGLRRPEGLIKCLESAVEKNLVDLSLLNFSPEVESPELIQAPTLIEAAAHDVESTGEAADTEEVGDGLNTDDQVVGVHRKTRRRSRGKGAEKRHEARMAAIAAGEIPAEKPKQQLTPDAPAVLEPQKVQPAAPALQVIVKAPEVKPEAAAEAPASLADALANNKARRMSFDDGKDDIILPVVSQSVRMLLERTQLNNSKTYDAMRIVSTEKIKVDQRLLETAVVQSSELTASRHRQLALQKDMAIGLTSVREKMEAHALHQNRFIQFLRGHINQPFGLGAVTTGSQEMQLERFNDISSMAVHSASYISQIVQDLEYVMEQGGVMQDSIRNQGRLISSLQRDLIHSRLVPFNNLKPALNSTIENTLKLLKKKARAEFTGGDTIIDKKILDAIKDPLFHIIRNALDHGLENEAERTASGKPAEGSLRIGVARRAKNMIITISDDGRGIDPVAVRDKALAIGLIKSTDEMTDREIIRLITHNGFSTAQSVGHISGRGVGMDIVASAVESMGGMLLIDSQVGKGTTFTLELPFSIGSNRAMICNTGGQWFAIPTFTMSHIAICQRSALEEQVTELGFAVYEHEGEQYNVVALSDLIAIPELKSQHDLKKTSTLILCKHGSTRVAIEVERVESMPEIHIRELEGILRNVRGLIGETELSDGSAIFVLDVMELIRINLRYNNGTYSLRQNRVRSVKRESRPLAFVVDDATSFRRLLTQYFESRGFEVITARDGQDAIDMLPLEREPSIITVDVEMPRLDGFGLTKRLRAMPEMDHIPIMMLTTRTGLEEQAAAVGVNAFQNKPCDWAAMDESVRKCRADLLPNEAAA